MNYSVLLREAYTYHLAGEYLEAEKRYIELLQVSPENPELHFLLGVLKTQTQNFEDAAVYFQNAQQVRTMKAAFYNDLGTRLDGMECTDIAIQSYQQALLDNPDLVVAYNNLANGHRSKGELNQAISLYLKGLALDPNIVEIYLNLGDTYQFNNDMDNAIASYEQCIERRPDWLVPYFKKAMALLSKGNEQDALNFLAGMVETRPAEEHEAIYCQIGEIFQNQGKLDKAVALYEKLLASKPESPLVYFNLAHCYQKMGQDAKALDFYGKVLVFDPDNMNTFYNLSVLFQHQPGRAESYLKKVIELQPSLFAAYERLLHFYKLQDKGDEALNIAKKAVTLFPRNAHAHIELGSVYHQYRNYQTALESYNTAMALNPNAAGLYDKVGEIYNHLGNMEEAGRWYEKANEVCPSPRTLYKRATMLPSIYNCKEDVPHWREHFTQEVGKLAQTPFKLVDPILEIGVTNFYLAYQGQNDRDLQSQIAQMYERSMEWVTQPAPNNKKPKIGFISHFMRPTHTIGKLFLGLAENLSREKFDVTLFGIALGDTSPLTAPHKYIHLIPDNMAAMRNKIIEEDLDIIFYPDIGMYPYTYFLAFNRLAPVQCVSVGHPVTTGIPNVDYVISSKLWESENAQDHYTEKLVALDNLPIYYRRPDLKGQTYVAENFGLPSDRTLYICPQALFKLHPEYDEIMGNILRQDPDGLLVLINPVSVEMKDLTMKRFSSTMPDVLDRVRILDALTYEQFLGLVSIGHVMLDPPTFSGGNTSLEAFAFGTPIVTMPSEFMRGRTTYGLYQKMGVTDCIVDSPEAYAALAVKLGRDVGYRQQIREKILAHVDVLYENRDILPELETFFLDALAEKKAQAAPRTKAPAARKGGKKAVSGAV